MHKFNCNCNLTLDNLQTDFLKLQYQLLYTHENPISKITPAKRRESTH